MAAAWRRSLALSLAITLFATACAEPAPSPTVAPPEGVPVEARAGGADGFELILRSASDMYAVGEPMDVSATLVYRGPLAGIEVFGSGSGPIAFRLEQLDGPIVMDPAMTADCAGHAFERDDPFHSNFIKSGGFSADDPLAGFWRNFFADPQLRLPSGTWRVTVSTAFDLQDCGGPPVRLSASLVLTSR